MTDKLGGKNWYFLGILPKIDKSSLVSSENNLIIVNALGHTLTVRHQPVLVVDFQPRDWRLKRKIQEFCGVPVRFGQGTP